MVCVNPELTTGDLDALLANVKAVAKDLPAGDNAMTN